MNVAVRGTVTTPQGSTLRGRATVTSGHLRLIDQRGNTILDVDGVTVTRQSRRLWHATRENDLWLIESAGCRCGGR